MINKGLTRRKPKKIRKKKISMILSRSSRETTSLKEEEGVGKTEAGVVLKGRMTIELRDKIKMIEIEMVKSNMLREKNLKIHGSNTTMLTVIILQMVAMDIAHAEGVEEVVEHQEMKDLGNMIMRKKMIITQQRHQTLIKWVETTHQNKRNLTTVRKGEDLEDVGEVVVMIAVEVEVAEVMAAVVEGMAVVEEATIEGEVTTHIIKKPELPESKVLDHIAH